MIADFLFRNPRILLLTILVLVVAGVTSTFVIPRLEDPVLSRRVAVISAAFPGADAEQVESLVTIPIEEALSEVAEIKQFRSNCRAGLSNTVLELKDEVTDVEPVWSRIENIVQRVRPELPAGMLEPDFEVFPLQAYSAIISVKWKSQAPNYAILRRIAGRLRTSILEIEGTEKADVFGDSGEEVIAEISPVKLAAIRLSIAAIAGQVEQELSQQPLGRVQGADNESLMDLASATTPLERLESTMISAGAEVVPLAELATIRKQPIQPSTESALVDGEPAMVIGALVNGDVRVDLWSDRLNEVLQKVIETHGNEVELETLFAQRSFIEQRMVGLLESLAIGAAAVVLIVFLLMGWRSMIVVVTALPLSALVVVFGLKNLSIPIHQMSVTGLIVALGLLIDNAIVMVEEVRSKVLSGATAIDAVRESVRHLAMPLFGSTLTTALAFLPIATLPGPAGEFVGSIAVSVILAICASFVLSMTVIPAMCGMIGQRGSLGWVGYGVSSPLLKKGYEKSLGFVFRLPVVGVVIGLALPVAGYWMASEIPKQFFPPCDRRQIQLEVERPTNDLLAASESGVKWIERILAQDPGVDRQHWFIGRSAPTFFYNVVPRRRGTPFYAQAFVDVADGHTTVDVVNRLQSLIDEQILDSRVVVRQLEQGPPFDAPLEIRIVGPDVAILQELGAELRKILSETGFVIHTRSDLQETATKISLDIDRLRLKQLGVTETSLAGQVFTSLEGAPAGTLFDGGEDLPVRIKLASQEREHLNQLRSLQLLVAQKPVFTKASFGHRVNHPPEPLPTLASVGEFRLDSNSGCIIRINGRRVNEIKAYIRAGVLPSNVMKEFRQNLSDTDFVLPEGYEIEYGGETEQRSQAVNNLIANAVLLFAIMSLTLVVSFRSFRCALIIGMVGGLSAGLGPLSLYAFGYPFGFMAIVGTMGLVGVAINDSIVVLAAIRGRHCRRVDEMVTVVSGCTRHIIATSLTTIVGFLPLIINGGGFWPPLAITIAGGIGGATVLALYFVPSLYLMLSRRPEAEVI